MKKLTALTAAALLALTACGDDTEEAQETPVVEATEDATKEKPSEDSDDPTEEESTKERPVEDETDDPADEPSGETRDATPVPGSIELIVPDNWRDFSDSAPEGFQMAMGDAEGNYNVLVREIGTWADYYPGAEAVQRELEMNQPTAEVTLVKETDDLVEFDVVSSDFTAVIQFVNKGGKLYELTLNGLNGHDARDHYRVLETFEAY